MKQEQSKPTSVKATDDYAAKVRLWAANPQIVPLPTGVRIPKFKSRRFQSYAEFNQWKKELILQMARDNTQIG